MICIVIHGFSPFLIACAGILSRLQEKDKISAAIFENCPIPQSRRFALRSGAASNIRAVMPKKETAYQKCAELHILPFSLEFPLHFLDFDGKPKKIAPPSCNSPFSVIKSNPMKERAVLCFYVIREILLPAALSVGQWEGWLRKRTRLTAWKLSMSLMEYAGMSAFNAWKSHKKG